MSEPSQPSRPQLSRKLNRVEASVKRLTQTLDAVYAKSFMSSRERLSATYGIQPGKITSEMMRQAAMSDPEVIGLKEELTELEIERQELKTELEDLTGGSEAACLRAQLEQTITAMNIPEFDSPPLEVYRGVRDEVTAAFESVKALSVRLEAYRESEHHKGDYFRPLHLSAAALRVTLTDYTEILRIFLEKLPGGKSESHSLIKADIRSLFLLREDCKTVMDAASVQMGGYF